MAGFHTRSISLPSRVHPAFANVDEQLCRLKASQDKSSSLFQQLSGLKELNECLEGLLELPRTQQALSKDIYIKQVLDGSLRMLDLCGTARDVFSQTKESLQEFESSLRRKRGSKSGFKNEISQYMESRKKLSKQINNSLKNLKKKCRSDNVSSESAAVVRTLEEIEEISISVFQYLISSISPPKSKSNWSMVSKLLKSKRSLCNKEDDVNETVKIEAELFELKSSKDTNIAQVQHMLKGIKAIELNVEEIAEELECIFRQLVKNRSTLLNILNH